MDTNFFQITEKLLTDKESLELKIQKVGDQLAVLVMPKIKEKKAIVTINGTAAELDEHFFNELQKPIEKINGLQSTADTAPIEDDEEAETSEEEIKKELKEDTAKAKEKKRGRKKSGIKELVSETAINEEEKQERETKPEQETNASTEQNELNFQAQEVDKEAEEKAHLEAEENARREKEELEATFTHYIESGDRAFNKHKYKQALDYYTKAEQLKPNNKEAGKKIELAAKWVKVLNENGLLNEEEEKEVSDGVENN